MRKLVPVVGIALFAIGCGGSSSTTFLETKSLTVVAGSGEAGSADGPISTATFNNPVNVAVAQDGTVYVVEYDGSKVRAIKDGVVRTVVSQSNFQQPFGITITTGGVVYVETDANDSGERDGTTGTIWRLNTTTGSATVVARNLGRPRGLATALDGTIVFSNLTRTTIQTLNPTTGVVATVAGQDGTAGFVNGTGAVAQFNRPYGLTREDDGSFLIADQGNHCIRRVTLTGEVTTFAGTGTAGNTNGDRSTARFNGPQDIKRVGTTYYVADTTGHLIRKISNNIVSTFAGNGTAGFVDSQGTAASFNGLEGIGASPSGDLLYVADGTGGEPSLEFNRVRVFPISV